MTTATILVVEDNPITRKMVRVALQSEGYAVLEAPDGKTALALMAQHAPALVLQDLLLPDTDGFDLVKQLRRLPGGEAVPILAVSGLLSQMELARTAKVGFTDYLFKPVEPAQLLGTVRAYLPAGRVACGRPGRGRRILVVDDDPIQRKLLMIQLEQLGFKVTTADDGVDALDKAQSSPPDAIVCDVLMPRLDGFRCCVALRQDPRLAQVPVLLTSAVYVEEADRRLAQAVGANAFILRTPDHREVAEALLGCLRQAPPPSTDSAPELPTDEYTHRVIRQLEHQVGLSAGLTRRLALLETELGVLGRIVDTLRKTPAVEAVLEEILYRCLDAAGISRGAAYLVDADGRLALRARLGYADAGAGALAESSCHTDLLQRVMERGEPLEVRSSRESGTPAGDLLTQSGARSILLTPLVLGEERLGVLEMASADRELGEDWVAFAKVIGNQIGHAVKLARTLSRLSAAEQHHLELLEGTGAVVWEAEARTGRFTFVSRRAEELLGHPVARWLTEPDWWVRLLHPEDRERAVARWREAVAGGRDHVLEYRLVAAGGDVVWVHDTVRVVRDAGGRALRLRGVMVDITERKRAEEALRGSEERYRLLFERNVAGILRTAVDGRVLDCNESLARILGYGSREEVLALHAPDFHFNPADRETLLARLREQAALVNHEICLRRKDGSPVWGLVNLSLLGDWDGGAVIQGTILDISERKQVKEHEAKLRLAREIQYGLFPSGAWGVPGFDIGGASYPAEATGGDYFDYVPMPEGCLAVAIGDVSGHGFGPALLMAETRAYLRALTLMRSEVGEIVTLLNRALAGDIAGDYFVTLLLAHLNPRTRSFVYASAGHSRGYLLDPAGGVKAVLDSTGCPLGIDADAPFPASGRMTLDPGDLVLLLTDGIVEARSPDDSLFGDERALQIVRLYRQDPARQIVNNLYHAVRSFSHNRPQADDITAVVVKVGPPP